jgi:hypothetical protein
VIPIRAVLKSSRWSPLKCPNCQVRLRIDPRRAWLPFGCSALAIFTAALAALAVNSNSHASPTMHELVLLLHAFAVASSLWLLVVALKLPLKNA